MSRNFNFSLFTKQISFSRQENKCACCGESLIDQYDNAHHIIPDQSSRLFQSNNNHWLKSSENCVIICETCHSRVHQNGRYGTGAVAPPSYFPFSHGKDSVAHLYWAKKLDEKWKLVKSSINKF